MRSEIWWDTSGTPQCSIGRQKLAGFGQINARPEKPRLGKKPAAGTRVGKIATRNARLRLGLRAIAIANAGRVGCWIRCHWRRGQCDCGAVDRDSLYGGSQTVVDNGDGTQTIKYGNVGYNATTVALATLIGGSAGALLGTNATGAALAAQNEALNNSTSDKVVKWAKETYKDPLGDLARWGKELLGMLPGQTPPTEANPLVDATNGGNPPATGGAVVTPPTMSCSASGQCVVTPPITSPGAPGNAILSTNGGDAGGEPGQGANADSGAPGRVQSRINLTNAGMDHIGDRHLDPTVNASQFAISESDLTKLLQDKNTVSTPITRAIRSGNDINYVREVDTGQVVGTDKFNGYQPTSTMTVITDKYGNLVTAFPGRLE